MPINTKADAFAALVSAWPQIVDETRQVLAGELHYQAMVYHALRTSGSVPLNQLGMNVKQWIPGVTSPLFQSLDVRKSEGFRGGFEPIPDVVIFKPDVAGNWQRRSAEATLQHMCVAIEVKASERHKKRLSQQEIILDIQKLSAHRQEVRRLGGYFLPVMMVIDVAAEPFEQMTVASLAAARHLAHDEAVAFFYVSRSTDTVDVPTSGTESDRFIWEAGDLARVPLA